MMRSRVFMDVLMSTATVLWCLAVLLPIIRAGSLWHTLLAIAICVLIPGDMVLAHWQRRYPWWYFAPRRHRP